MLMSLYNFYLGWIAAVKNLLLKTQNLLSVITDKIKYSNSSDVSDCIFTFIVSNPQVRVFDAFEKLQESLRHSSLIFLSSTFITFENKFFFVS